jgi:hypothetical protein
MHIFYSKFLSGTGRNICGSIHTHVDKEQFIEHHGLLVPELIKTGLPQPGIYPIFAIMDPQLDVECMFGKFMTIH